MAVVAAGLVVAGKAQAADYTASNESELFAAINSANADGDAASTITLTSGFTISAPGSLPAVTKSLLIDAGSYTVSSAGNVTYDVAEGAKLTLKGDIDGTGVMGKSGDGMLAVIGAGSAYTKNGQFLAGEYRVENGSVVSMGNSTDGSVNIVGNGASVVVSGAGSKIVGAGSGTVSAVGGASFIVENGGRYESLGGFTVANDNYTVEGTLTVRGAGSSFSLGSTFSVMRGTGYVNILDGAKFTSASGGIGGAGVIQAFGGTGYVVVSGEQSSWTMAGQLGVHNGLLSVLDGGLVQATYFRAGLQAIDAVRDLPVHGRILVSGEGSALIATSGTESNIATGGTATLTVADKGRVTINSGNSALSVAKNAAGNGTINIGGGVGEAAVAAGTLEVSALSLGAGTATLNFNHTDAAYGFDIALNSGSGAHYLNHFGSGKTVLTADQAAFTGLSTVYGGTLAVNGILGGTMDVRGGRLQGIGAVGDTANYAGGIIAPGNSIGTFTIDGDYTGEGGMFEIEAELGDDGSPTDLLVITGNSLIGSAPTQVRVINVGGAGGQTTADGIRIVDVQGDSAAGAFVLGSPAIGGAYRYDLFQHDLFGTQDDGDWYLRSSGLAPTLPAYEAYPVVLLGLVDLPTLQQRVGDRHVAAAGGDAATPAGGVWTRIEAAHARVEGDSSVGLSYDSDRYLIQAGIDGQLLDSGLSSLIGGVNFQYGRDAADMASSIGDGSNATDSFGAGATLTWYGADGIYVDAQAQIAALRSKLSADELGVIEDGLKGVGYAFGIEAGRSFRLGEGWSVTPQAQLVYAAVDFDDFTDPYGAEVSLRDGDSLKGRIGLELGRETAGGSAYGLANLTYEFLDGTSVDVSGEVLDFTPDAFGAELGVGSNYAWAGGKYAVHGEVLVESSFSGSYGVKGTLGITSRF